MKKVSQSIKPSYYFNKNTLKLLFIVSAFSHYFSNPFHNNNYHLPLKYQITHLSLCGCYIAMVKSQCRLN